MIIRSKKGFTWQQLGGAFLFVLAFFIVAFIFLFGSEAVASTFKECRANKLTGLDCAKTFIGLAKEKVDEGITGGSDADYPGTEIDGASHEIIAPSGSKYSIQMEEAGQTTVRVKVFYGEGSSNKGKPVQPPDVIGINVGETECFGGEVCIKVVDINDKKADLDIKDAADIGFDPFTISLPDKPCGNFYLNGKAYSMGARRYQDRWWVGDRVYFSIFEGKGCNGIKICDEDCAEERKVDRGNCPFAVVCGNKATGGASTEGSMTIANIYPSTEEPRGNWASDYTPGFFTN